MKRLIKTILSMMLVFALVFSTLLVLPQKTDKVYAETNQFGVVKGTAIDDQDIYDSLMDLIDHCDSPEDFACWAAKCLLAGALRCDDDPNYQSVDEKLDNIIHNQEAILQSINSLDEKIVKSNILDNMKSLLQDGWDGTLETACLSFDKLDKQFQNATTEEEKQDIIQQRKFDLMFGLLAKEPDSEIINGIDEKGFDAHTYLYGSYLTQNYAVVYGSGSDTLYGMYNRLLKYNYKWEHHAYDIRTSFQNACLGKYLTMVSLDRASLAARIEAYEKGYTDSKGTFHPGHDTDTHKETADMLRTRLEQLNDQVKAVKELERKNLVKERPDNVRYYQYPDHEMLIYQKAKQVYIPTEPSKESPGDLIDDWLNGVIPTMQSLYFDPDSANIYPNVPFWRPLISYDYPNNSLSVSYEWLKQVYDDYGGKRTLKSIFADENEAGMSLPSGMDDTWQFVVNPGNNHAMEYWDGGIFRADRCYTPVGTYDKDGHLMLYKQIVYYYHSHYNEKPSDSYVNKLVSIGVVPDSEKGTNATAVGSINTGDDSLCLAKAKSTSKNKNTITIRHTYNATKYKVYACKCKGNKKGTFKKIKTIKRFTNKSAKYVHKKLKKGYVYKYKVVAFNGKKKLATSNVMYSIAGNHKKKYSNVKKISTSNKKITMKVGDKKKLTVKITTYKNKKVLKSTRKVRFLSSDKSNVTVDKKGRIKALTSGKAFVYVQGVNGVWKAIEVIVQ